MVCFYLYSSTIHKLMELFTPEHLNTTASVSCSICAVFCCILVSAHEAYAVGWPSCVMTQPRPVDDKSTESVRGNVGS